MKDIFIVHHSVFNDAFRKDYQTLFRDSSKNFLNMLLKHKIYNGTKISFTSGEVFSQLYKSSIGKTETIWVIPEYLVEIDFSTYISAALELNLDQSIIRLASKKCVESTPYIVATKPENSIDKEGTNFMILTPAKAIELYHHPNSFFK